VRRLLLLAVGAALAVVGVAGCGGTSVRHDARVSGSVKLCGGPAPGRCFTEQVHVAVLDADKHVVASSNPSHGRFSFSLASGAYTVLATNGGQTVGKTSVRAVAGQTRHANITDNNVK
jgi:hypothetical protein